MTAYQRELRLDDALVRVQYGVGDTTFTRTHQANFPDQVVAMHFTADRPGAISLRARMLRGPRGTPRGCCARGGFVQDLKWADGRLTRAGILSRLGSACRVRYGELTREIPLAVGERVVLDGMLRPVE